jgi:SPP1 family predicted phage head-tail adaptor
VGNDINPGSLRHKIIVQSLSESVDDAGVNTVNYIDFKTLWAKIDYQNSRESGSTQVRPNDTIKCTVRYTKDIDPSMRVLFLGKTFNITNVDYTKYSNKFIEIKATEILPKVCAIYRSIEVQDNLNRPQQALNQIGKYPCTIMRRSTDYIQQVPNAIASDRFILIGPANMNVQAGDLIEVDSQKYIGMTPFQPNKYQTEIELVIKKDV